MAVREIKIEETKKSAPLVANRGHELTHAEDFELNGDYLGRLPGDTSGRNHFDEEYFVDDSANEKDAQKHH